jgi:hypothetical protein
MVCQKLSDIELKKQKKQRKINIYNKKYNIRYQQINILFILFK